MFADRLLFLLLLILLPTQLAKHFFFDFSLVLGLRVDFLAVTVYLTDILVFLILFLWVLRKRKKEKDFFTKIVSLFKKPLFLFLLVFFLINLFLSSNKILTLIKLIKLLELLFLAIYVKTERLSLKTITQFLAIGAIYSSLLAIGQFVVQQSLGGFWWFLGERTFSVQTLGIARAIIFGQLKLRPYATFPHPNVLGAYLALLLPLILLSLFSTRIKKQYYYYLVLFILLLTTLILTFSRLAIVVGLLGVLFSIVIFFNKGKKISFTLLLSTLFLVLLLGNLIIGRFVSLFSGLESTLALRNELVRASLKMIGANPVVGVGLNNFLTQLPKFSPYAKTYSFVQPVHNTYLLIWVEAGLVGLSVFMLTLLKTLDSINRNFDKEYKNVLLLVFVQVLVLLFFDHYFYTLQQGQLLLAILFGFMMKKRVNYDQD